MENPTTIGPGAEEVARAAARAIAPTDPAIQDLLTRKALGQKLSPAEYGKLGQFKAKQQRSGALPQSTQTTAAAGAGQAPGNDVQSQAAAAGLALSAPDSAFVSRTVGALLTSLNSIGQRHLVAQARVVAVNAQKVGVAPPNISRFEAAEVVSPDHKAVMMETAPLVCEACGINPKHVPIGAFLGSAGLVALDFYSAMTELREINASIAEALKKLGDRKPEPPASAPAGGAN